MSLQTHTLRPLVAGNWKMNTDVKSATALVNELVFGYTGQLDALDLAIAPPFTALRSAQTVLSFEHRPIKLVAQNVSEHKLGAYTGEIAVEQIADLDCEFVILGHSERRQLLGETDKTINAKLHRAYEYNAQLLATTTSKQPVTPILCVGESIDVYEAGQSAEFIKQQLISGLVGISKHTIFSEKKALLAIAYEPIWAIGTGQAATPEVAEKICKAIRTVLKEVFDSAVADYIRVLYGGSVKPGNAELYSAQNNINGVLVGGASLVADDFLRIAQAFV